MLGSVKGLQAHLRNKFLAGGLAAGPVFILAYGAYWLEEQTKPLTKHFGFHFPGLGILLAVVLIYLVGLLVTSVAGRMILILGDKALRRVPGLSLLYLAWKDVMVVGQDKTGVFHKVVLVPDLEGQGAQLGFTSGEPVPGDPHTVCVFLPNAPNPISGRLTLIDRDACLFLPVSIEEAFKHLLSTGNYVPAQLQRFTSRRPEQKG